MRDQDASNLYLEAGKHMLADLPLSMVLTDPNRPDNPIVYVNRAFEQTTGYAASHAVGRNCRFLQADDRDQDAVRKLREAVAAQKPTTVILRNYRSDGEQFLNRLMIAPVTDEEGQLFAFVGIQVVITESGADSGSPEASDFTDTLREMQHRVKNHLQMVASMIRLQSTSDAPPEAAFKLLSRRVESLAALYDEFARPPTGSRGGAYDVVSAGAYVGRVASTVAALDGRSGIRLTVDTDPVHMDSSRAASLGLLVSEVLSNAMQHGFDDRAEGLVEVRLKQAGGDRVRLTVTDDGCGLGDSDWPNSGGMGARIVRGLAGQLGGDLNVATGAGGTTVTLDIVNETRTSLDTDGDRMITGDGQSDPQRALDDESDR
ncbi:PAS domain-containing protein [Jannaschia aquimarina]|uniref:Blue-light-activated histidine kinase 2 n=1 Tax=Jannaschia aquimarina TaxID=935700 RepID=A0A0D1CKD9_9RHOB|nr:PAS domain-containing protein [Jannaschia aquimarina]KIT15212.1 Blue-light-activated histidine kinase 2 [Jannaschia aquimarina]SNT32850.1 PAS domain S-box-containing protein [Jannaschia aquimarina]